MENKKILRLLLWEDCDRNCPGCCNKDYDLKNLPICNDFSPYDLIILTGGEPLIRPMDFKNVVRKIRKLTTAPVFLYTANSWHASIFEILDCIDGICITLHEQKDVEDFLYLHSKIKDKPIMCKNLRLNIFEGIEIDTRSLSIWKIRENMRWIKNCPLPENEVFMRLDSSFI